MGSCKDQMTAKDTKKVDKDKGGVFGMIKRRRGATVVDTPEKVVDHLESLEKKLTELVTIKRRDLESETGREAYNARALAILETMTRLNDQLIDLAADYSELN